MDSTLNEFLNEINEIAPLKKTKKEIGWKKCFDAKSGFSYYWNTKTDEVTWEEPKNFELSKSNISSEATQSQSSSIPELFNKVKDTVKIYRISSNGRTPIPKSGVTSKSKKILPKKFSRDSDSDDEKITLITSYGTESESEGDEEIDDHLSEASRTSSKRLSHSDDEDTDILSTVRKRAEELKKIGQADIKNILIKAEETNPDLKLPKMKPPVSGFSLIAGYDSNSEEDETEENEPKELKIDQPADKQQNYSHSTLFPIVKPPDLNDFIETQEVTVELPPSTVPENPFDSKHFQRKRRLGVNFVPTQRNNMNLPLPVPLEGERKGLGFNSVNSNSNIMTKSSNNFYSNFASGGVEFVKPNTLDGDDPKEKESDDIDMEQIEKIYEVLHEKLAFLCEGNKDVVPVQIILIQIETLFGALKAKCLKSSYLHEWLKGTNEDLIKLEKEAAPEGWLLQWNRSRKRYYYHNQSTGEGRWEYPVPDVIGQEEAMDISTTPPPPDAEEEQPMVVKHPPLPPSPPRKSPSPPPPPIISRPDPQPIPEAPSAPKITFDPNDEPPPPGVDLTESTEYRLKPKAPETNINDIDSAFDSFYSELASIESTSNAPSPSNVIEPIQQTDTTVQETKLTEPPKKKKKKVKLGQGLSLKKKDVSKLVEKWKNVQKNFQIHKED